MSKTKRQLRKKISKLERRIKKLERRQVGPVIYVHPDANEPGSYATLEDAINEADRRGEQLWKETT